MSDRCANSNFVMVSYFFAGAAVFGAGAAAFLAGAAAPAGGGPSRLIVTEINFTGVIGLSSRGFVGTLSILLTIS